MPILVLLFKQIHDPLPEPGFDRLLRHGGGFLDHFLLHGVGLQDKLDRAFGPLGASGIGGVAFGPLHQRVLDVEQRLQIAGDAADLVVHFIHAVGFKLCHAVAQFAGLFAEGTGRIAELGGAVLQLSLAGLQGRRAGAGRLYAFL